MSLFEVALIYKDNVLCSAATVRKYRIAQHEGAQYVFGQVDSITATWGVQVSTPVF